MRACLGFSTWLFLAACHHTPAMLLSPDAPRVVVVAEDSGGSFGTDPSRATSFLVAAIAQELAEHGYATTTAATSSATTTLTLRTQTEFFAQIAGRYRWTVRARATLEGSGRRIENTWEIPVFLVYDHEREADAVLAAVPSIQRHLDTLRAVSPAGVSRCPLPSRR